MPLFDYQCPKCKFINEVLVIKEQPRMAWCKLCDTPINTRVAKGRIPGAPSFKIKGMRAANGYGLKFMDTYGKSKTDGHESGYSFTSNKGTVVDHNQGQERKV